MITIILPVHNEAKTLRANVGMLKNFLKKDYEIILAEDGSTDGSAIIAKQIPGTLLITSKEKLGRGLALSNAIKQAKGETIVYMDADLATGLSHINDLLKCDADIVTGSRLLSGSVVTCRSITREFFSRGYNLLVRILFNSKVMDHQCGFKAFKKSVLPLLDEIQDHHWFWDSELLIRAQRKGLTIKEIPVKWMDRKNSKVKLHNDIIYMGLAAIRLRFTI
ncbi:glycosyltransferase [Candidatus Micrarchaeota archaeon]|nr:glycosyltransferase [Candidatus Micrarchaeota archaeon]